MNYRIVNAQRIPQSTLRKVWHSQYPNESMPRIIMHTQKPKDFAKGVRKNFTPKERKKSLKDEYGQSISIKNLYGYTMHSTKGYVIVAREGSPKRSPIVSAMKHEFKHIRNKDI